jgi:NADH:ubiquinone reductase (H+-translocating)
VKGREDVWAGGDCASVPHPHGGTCPPVALYACMHGRRLGDNIARRASSRPPKPYRTDVKLQGVSIGRRTSVGEMGGLGMRGTIPWLGWRTAIMTIVPTWDRRLRMLADWTLWPMVGRDIAQVTSPYADDYYVEHNVFQPGDVLLERRRSSLVHVIVSGTAEVVGRDSGATTTLGPGDYFSDPWLEREAGDTVCAVSAVETVSMRNDQAGRLQRILRSAKALD